MITARQNSKYITRNRSHFKLIDPVIKEMTDKEEQEEDDESNDAEQGTFIESGVLIRDLRHSECGFKHFGQNIYE